jgi:NTP pyrophosphatase (non-canonical NTP hydrolase)|tara:strand:- start:6892 stop:7260 length:369 start_codon:yes stop_codon:yes gene_type:complete
MTVTFQQLRAANEARLHAWHGQEAMEGDVPQVWTLSDWGVAAAGEMGEACNIIKKLNRYRDGLVGNKETKEELMVELGIEIADIVIYLDLLALAAGIDLGEQVVSKFNAVSKKHGFPQNLGE